MAKSPALFLDRDGNLIEDHHHTCQVDQVILISGVKPALRACLSAGYKLFILTNQSGINRGIFTWEQYHACNQRMLELLDLPAPGILEIKAAPEKPDEPSLYRKPSPQFILEMIEQHELDPALCWMVGDRITDWDAGLNAGIKSCAVRSGAGRIEDFIYAEKMKFTIRQDFPEFVRQDLGLNWHK
jgi:D-glycero-D-manno-heptose 1,7-bisphosphate phosphatase